MPVEEQFLPFYDRRGDGGNLSFSVRLALSMGTGFGYTLLQYISLSNKAAFVTQRSWILGVIIAAALLSVYVATDLFRRNLPLVKRLEGRFGISTEVMNSWMTDRGYILTGVGMAAINTGIGHLLGVPAEFHDSAFALTMIYAGFALAGFACGLGLYGIAGIIVLYLKLSPCLHYSLDPDNPDGSGGIRPLGDALWFYGLLTAVIALLVTLYLFGVDWTATYREMPRGLLLIWAATPYLVAVSLVLIPGLAVRRNVQFFKQQKTEQLIRERTKIYSSLKDFREQGDTEIVEENRRLADRITRIHEQMARLRAMRDSHIDS